MVITLTTPLSITTIHCLQSLTLESSNYLPIPLSSRRALRVAGIKRDKQAAARLTGLHPHPGCSLLCHPSILPIPALRLLSCLVPSSLADNLTFTSSAIGIHQVGTKFLKLVSVKQCSTKHMYTKPSPPLLGVTMEGPVWTRASFLGFHISFSFFHIAFIKEKKNFIGV